MIPMGLWTSSDFSSSRQSRLQRTIALVTVGIISTGVIGCELEPYPLPDPCLRFDNSMDDPEARLKIAGSINGEEFHTRHRPSVGGSSTGTVNLFFTTLGRITLFPEDPAEEGESLAASGLFRMPAEGPSPLGVFCAGTGTVLYPPGPATYSLRSLAALGACPGMPVGGQLSVNVEFMPMDDKGIESTIPGAEFKWVDEIAGAGLGSMAGTSERPFNVDLENGGIVIVDMDDGVIRGALLMIAPNSPDAGAVYCAGSGSILKKHDDDFPTDMVLNDLSRLGSCTTADLIEGEVDVCW